MPIVFEAAADAPLGGKLIDFTARHADPKQNIVGSFANSADFIRGAPGQSIYKRKAVDRLAIAVVEELPFTLEIIEPKVPLVRNGSMQLKIVVHRKEGFKGAVNVTLPFRPPGLGAASSVNIPAGKNEALYPISANGGAQIKKWRIYALGSSNVGGTAWVSSQLANLEIAAPFVTFAVQRASCEQGEEAQIYCKLNHAAAFEGTAKVRLLGLPPKVATVVMELNKDTKELTFVLKTEKDTKPGKYNNVFAQLTITQNGEPIVSRAGGTQLQIDKPLPPPPGQPVAKAKPKPVPKPVAGQPKPAPPKPPKPLTRLQKLRLAAKQRAEAKAAAREAQETGGGSK
ncbi:MAG: hypothetical protein HON53_18880 [Planctomycetaceae bacterium]|nr:hypothetical protein [Planctomycetaceae bacterium]